MQGIFPSFSQGELVMYQHLHSAAQIIQAGGVVAYPTESVYGLGCDPFNESAVMHLLAIKERPVSKGLILIGADLSQLAPYLRLTDSEDEQLAGQWPAPRTYLVEAGENVPAWVRGAFSKVAVRRSFPPVPISVAARRPAISSRWPVSLVKGWTLLSAAPVTGPPNPLPLLIWKVAAPCGLKPSNTNRETACQRYHCRR